MVSDPLRVSALLRPQRRRLCAALAGAGLVAFAWIAGGFRAFTWQSTVSVAIPGVALVALAARGKPARIPSPDRLDLCGASYWLIAAFSFFEWECAAWMDGSRPWHPTLSVILAPLFDHHMIKSAAFLTWMIGGWELLRR